MIYDRQRGKTHWPDCWRNHHECAIEKIERLSEIVEISADLTALWKAQKISGLPRSDRNAAIENVRNRLIEALDRLKR